MPSNLVEQSARHAIYTQRFAAHLANQFDPYSTRLKRELRLILSDAPETTNNLRRINQIISEYRTVSLALYSEYNDKEILSELEDFAVAESEWGVKTLSAVVDSSSIVLATPAPVQLWAGVSATPLVVPGSNGINLLEPFIKNWEANRIELVGNQIRTGFMTGQTNSQITTSIAGKNGFLDKQNTESIKTLVRTSTNHVSNIARQKTYELNDDIVKGYEIIATLDGRTSDICRGYDGKIVKNGDSFKPMPPFHPNCRTSTAPVLDKRFSLDDGEGTRASRGIEGGQQVPEEQTYYDWLKGQGAQGPKGRAFVEDVLGQERAKLFLDGGLSVTKFKQLTMDDLFRPLPLSELKKKSSLQMAFDKI